MKKEFLAFLSGVVIGLAFGVGLMALGALDVVMYFVRR